MAIYSKRGDKGRTDLFNKSQGRVSKDSLVVKAIGAVDELNSFLGIVCSRCENSVLKSNLIEIQKDLLTIGSILAGSNLRFFKTKTKKLEKEIDKLEKQLPRLSNFIIPGGSRLASLLHYARSVARRAEREIIALAEIEDVKAEILIFLNRLSDYLFMLARDANFKVGIKEEIWREKGK